MSTLEGRVAVVTGGNRGIGIGIAEALAGAGADIAIWARDEERNAEAAETLGKLGTRVLPIRCDISDEDDVVAAMAATVAGLGKVDTLVANAGLGTVIPFTDLSLRQFRKVTAVNLEGTFLCLREVARHLIERDEGGSLVAVTSVSSIDGAARMGHYAATKAGIGAMMRALAVELARHSIRCNVLMPGWVESDMNVELRKNEKFVANVTSRTPMRRFGRPSDLGPAAVFLADPEAAFHTGDTIVVDGGYTIF